MNHGLGSVGRVSRKETACGNRSAPPYRNNTSLRTSRNYAARERAVCTTAESESTFSVNFNFFFSFPSLPRAGKTLPGEIGGEAKDEKND